MRVAFRADASLTMGTGHVMRCLTLADAMRSEGVQSVFLSRDHPGHLHRMIQERGHLLYRLGGVNETSVRPLSSRYDDWLGVEAERDATETQNHLKGLSVEWLVVDHYSIDAEWELAVRPFCGRIMSVDDLANRKHVVDALLDQNLGKSESDYESLVPESCKLMIGSRYALLRPEFADLRTKSLSRRAQGRLNKILVSMGGVDLENVTSDVLDALNSWGPSSTFEVIVVMGPCAPWRNKVAQQAMSLSFPVKVLTNVKDMAGLMHDTDLAIGAAGSTSWERCCMGLPTLQIVLADNQRPIADAISRVGAAYLLVREELRTSLGELMDQLVRDQALLLRMSRAAASVVDGAGAKRVARFLTKGQLQ